MHARKMKDGVYAQFARIGKAIAAPKRIELLELLCLDDAGGIKRLKELGDLLGCI